MFHLNSNTVSSLTNAELLEWINACEKEQMQHLTQVAKEILKSRLNLVALAGPSCSGKTTTAHRLISLLSKAGKKVKVISTDDYFHNICDYPKSSGGAPDFDHFDCMKKSLLSEVLRGICAGEEVALSRFDFITGRRTDDVERYRPEKDSVIILEGIHAHNPLLYKPTVQYYKLGLNVTKSIYLDGKAIFEPREIRLLRRIIRDEKKRNYRAEQTMNIWKNVVRGEDNFILPFFGDADHLLSTGLAYEPFVWRGDVLNSLEAIPQDDPFRAWADELIRKVAPFAQISPSLVPQGSILQEFLGLNDD